MQTGERLNALYFLSAKVVCILIAAIPFPIGHNNFANVINYLRECFLGHEAKCDAQNPLRQERTQKLNF